MPNMSFGAPPFYGSQLAYRSFLPRAVPVSTMVNKLAAMAPYIQNLTVFAATSLDGTAVVLRLLNNNSVTVNSTIEFNGRSSELLGRVGVTTLSSPLFGSSAYKETDGGAIAINIKKKPPMSTLAR